MPDAVKKNQKRHAERTGKLMSKIIVCDFGLILHRCIFLYKMICIGEINRILGLSKEEDLIAQDVLGMLDFNQEERLQAAYPDHFEQLKAIRRIPVTYNCLNMISGYMNQLKFNPKEDEVVLACDYGRSWRKKVDLSYKAQRKENREAVMSGEWWKQKYDMFNDLIERMDKGLPFQVIKIWEIEADDIASYVCRHNPSKSIICITTDEDWQMLCQFPNVKIWSPVKKDYYDVKYPLKILAKKIDGDISDNLLTKPQNEFEFERRKQIVNLLELPAWVDDVIKEVVDKQVPKNLQVQYLPFPSMQKKFLKIYGVLNGSD